MALRADRADGSYLEWFDWRYEAETHRWVGRYVSLKKLSVLGQVTGFGES